MKLPTITRQSVTGQALALVPLVVGLLFGALVLPRSVPPDEIPSPTIDARSLARAEADDDARAARVAAAPLSSTVRAVGSSFRGFNTAEANHEDEAAISEARNAIIRAVRDTTTADTESMKVLRAFQLAAFLAEVRRFEHTGEISEELRQLGGTFIERMTKVGWCVGHHVAMSDPVRRAAFKLTWNHTLLLDKAPAFALTLDETRVLYAFYFSHPHIAEAERARVAVALDGAPDAVARERAREAADRATAGWLLVKIGELGQADPTYPRELARGAALFMKQDYRASAAVYQGWLDTHPGGFWTLRVQNHLRAALLAAEKTFQ